MSIDTKQLVNILIPLEVLTCQIKIKPYKEITEELQNQIIEAVESLRKLIFENEQAVAAYKTVGRLLVRKFKAAGLFIPFEFQPNNGLYEVKEIMGENVLTYLGEPDMPNIECYNVGDLVQNPHALMTTKELQKVSKS